jgi:hypothetical protein
VTKVLVAEEVDYHIIDAAITSAEIYYDQVASKTIEAYTYKGSTKGDRGGRHQMEDTCWLLYQELRSN